MPITTAIFGIPSYAKTARWLINLIMTYLRMLPTVITLLLLIATCCEARDWQGIVPLQSTRADVERLLGKPNTEHDRYLTGNEVGEFFYSTSRCSNGWNVPAGTVISITVTFSESRRLSDLKLDLGKYVKITDPFTPNHTYYVNRNEGVRYVVLEGSGETSQLILAVYYESTSKDEQFLRCSNLRKTKQAGTCPPGDICPLISISCLGNCIGPEYVFAAVFTPVCPDQKPLYNWTASGGRIIKGQGTSTITVRRRKNFSKAVIARLRIKGSIPIECPNAASYRTSNKL